MVRRWTRSKNRRHQRSSRRCCIVGSEKLQTHRSPTSSLAVAEVCGSSTGWASGTSVQCLVQSYTGGSIRTGVIVAGAVGTGRGLFSVHLRWAGSASGGGKQLGFCHELRAKQRCRSLSPQWPGACREEPRWQRARATPAAPCPVRRPVMPRARDGPARGPYQWGPARGGAIPPAWPGLASTSCVTVTER